MKTSASLRFLAIFVIVFSLLSPAAVLAMGDGNKHFKEGMKHEVAERWDTAAEEFALAVTDNPKNPEYRLHLQRALFNASQMYMKKGTAAAKEGDFEGGYNAFRKAYGYDPTNELAKSEMERMIRLQQGIKDDSKKDDTGKVKLIPTGYISQKVSDNPPIPQRLEKLRDVPFPGGVDLQFLVKELAKDLDLNVLFDSASRLDNRRVKIELKNVTAPKALDYLFLQENLFFQRVGPRTILVADGNRRTNFQQLVLRTFYLANANPKDVQAVIQSAIPAQPGRSQTIVLKDDATNSITVRDTEENIRLISKLISSLDKDRAEVVMDVNIYEVSKSDLMQLGNQIGDQTQLSSLGGTTRSAVGLGGNDLFSRMASTATSVLPAAFGVGFALPAANLIAFQNKNNTKLLASTQIHAFNNEDSSARIGQRVPVRTATIQTGNQVGSGGIVSDVINYEQVGLTLKFKPIVFPNQDVQVAMEIESKDVVAGGTVANPVFSERTIKGTARVQNNKTLLLASVAQDVQSNGRQGLPLLGLIPVLGRLFTAPTKDNRQVDIVIAVTPKVIRAPAILPEDEAERPTGSLATPTNGSLEAMIIQEDRDDLLAAARRVPNTAEVQLPDQKADTPTYVRASNEPQQNVQPPVTDQKPAVSASSNEILAAALKPIDSGVKTLQVSQTSNTSTPPVVQTLKVSGDETKPADNGTGNVSPTVNVRFASPLPVNMRKGDRARLAVTVDGSREFRSAVLGFRFDDKKLAVRSIAFGDMFGIGLANSNAEPFLNQSGKTFVSLSMPQGAVQSHSGVLAVIEIEALADGQPEIAFERDVMNLLTADGKNFVVKF
jgi:Type II secretory pathway, component PulD